MRIRYPEIGICGLSCVLCPSYHAGGKSRCGGCKSAYRMGAGCPFITCAVKKKGVEFCWLCGESAVCPRWNRHRAAGRKADSFKCYQTLEADIAFLEKHGAAAFRKNQRARERLLRAMLGGFDDGRSKSYYCIAATVMEPGELRGALGQAGKLSGILGPKDRARALHALLDGVAVKKRYRLKLRKRP